jgi:hypothetical protein
MKNETLWGIESKKKGDRILGELCPTQKYLMF